MSDTVCTRCGSNHSGAIHEGLCGVCLVARAALEGSRVSWKTGATDQFGGGMTGLETIAQAQVPIRQADPRDTEGAAAPEGVLPGGNGPPRSANGHIELIELIDHGGMGEVYRGRDTHFNRDLAVKILLLKHRGNPDLVRRFVAEGQIAAQLQHPGNVPVYEMGNLADGRPYFTMKLVKGRKLSELMHGRRAPSENLSRLLAIFEDIAQTIAYAHDRGVMHRDLKPNNVLVGGFGEVQVIDWGLAKLLFRNFDVNDATWPTTTVRILPRDDDPGGAATRVALGTAQYMSPEQARHELHAVDQRTDVFALGLILCEMLTGRAAYDRESALRMARAGDLASAHIRLATCGADPELIALAAFCLRLNPNDRPKDAGVVGAAIKAYLEGVRDRLRDAELARAKADARAEAEQARAEAEASRAQAEASRAEAESSRAEAERAKRKLIAALASLVVLALTLGGGSLAFHLQSTAALRARTNQEVGESLARADSFRSEAQQATRNDLAAWERALQYAMAAENNLKGKPANPDLVERVRVTRGAIAAHVERVRRLVRLAESDLRLVDRLAEARLEGARVRGETFDLEAKLAAYAGAFRDAGLDPANPDRSLVARLSAGEHREQIAAALDDWAAHEPGSELQDRLFKLAYRVDPDSGRNSIREAIRSGDLDTLIALADNGDNAPKSATAVGLRAESLSIRGARAEAITLLTKGQRQFPSDFWLNEDLGVLLDDGGPSRSGEAIRFLTAAVAIKPDSAGAFVNLGRALSARGRHAEAEDAFRKAIQLKPTFALALTNLGNALCEQGKLKEAEALCREALAIDPRSASAHNHLGITLGRQRRYAEAEAELRKAIESDPAYAAARGNLGITLGHQRRYAEAEAELRKVVQLDQESAIHPTSLGRALSDQGRYAEAEAECRKAIEIDPAHMMAHYNLGFALSFQDGKLPEAEAAYREAIRLDPTYPEAHCNLGFVLRLQGRYLDAIEPSQKGHELGSRRAGWTYDSAGWVKLCKAKIALEKRLPAILGGGEAPRDNADRLALAEVAYETNRYADAARFWGEALDADPKFGDDRQASYRYEAARSAARAATDLSGDHASTDHAGRADLRAKALRWLGEELGAWQKLADSTEPGNRKLVARALTRWWNDPDFAKVRGDELDKRPEPERKAWQALWADVDALRAKVAKP